MTSEYRVEALIQQQYGLRTIFENTKSFVSDVKMVFEPNQITFEKMDERSIVVCKLVIETDKLLSYIFDTTKESYSVDIPTAEIIRAVKNYRRDDIINMKLTKKGVLILMIGARDEQKTIQSSNRSLGDEIYDVDYDSLVCIGKCPTSRIATFAKDVSAQKCSHVKITVYEGGLKLHGSEHDETFITLKCMNNSNKLGKQIGEDLFGAKTFTYMKKLDSVDKHGIITFYQTHGDLNNYVLMINVGNYGRYYIAISPDQ